MATKFISNGRAVLCIFGVLIFADDLVVVQGVRRDGSFIDIHKFAPKILSQSFSSIQFLWQKQKRIFLIIQKIVLRA